MNVLDLFSGIGGFALGFQRAGFQPVAFCECDGFARGILARNWPGIRCYEDIRILTAARLRQDGVPPPQILCGGFPCQDISTAGRGAGLQGARSGLWHEMLRLVRDCGPDWVVVENVPALRVRGADQVLDGLETAGYACWPLVVGAAHAAAPHRRARVFLLAHAHRARLEERFRGAAKPYAGVPVERCRGWPVEPGLGRVAHGVPARVDRLRALGNAVVPDVAEMIARAILAGQAAVERMRPANTVRNMATCGAVVARPHPAFGLRA